MIAEGISNDVPLAFTQLLFAFCNASQRVSCMKDPHAMMMMELGQCVLRNLPHHFMRADEATSTG